MDTRCLIYLGGLHVHSISSIAATKKTTDRWMVLSATIIVYMPSLPMCLIAFISIIRAGLGCGYQWGEHRKRSVRCMLFQQRSHW